jgi:amino acid transporter
MNHAATLQAMAIFILFLITAINCGSSKLSVKLQEWLTGLKTIALVLIGILGLVHLVKDYDTPGTPPYDNFRRDGNRSHGGGDGGSGGNTWGEFGVAILTGLWSYDGWNNLNLATEELKDPVTNLPRSIFIAVPLVTLCYVFANVGYLSVLRMDQIVDYENDSGVEGFATVFGKVALGAAGTVILPVCIALSTFGAANGSAFSGGRLVHAAAVNGDFCSCMAELLSFGGDPSPVRALLFQSSIAVLLVLAGDFEALVAGFNVAAWTFYLQAGATVLVGRQQQRSFVNFLDAYVLEDAHAYCSRQQRAAPLCTHRSVRMCRWWLSWWLAARISIPTADTHLLCRLATCTLPTRLTQAVSCLLVLRWREPDLPRPVKVWTAAPIVFMLIAFMLIIATIKEQPAESAVAIAGVLTAVPVYYGSNWLRARGYLGEASGVAGKRLHARSPD